METLKSKLRVFWAVAAAVVVLLGGIGAKDVLANDYYFEAYSDSTCRVWVASTYSIQTIWLMASAGYVRSFRGVNFPWWHPLGSQCIVT